MNSKKSLALVSTSAFAAGIAQGAVITSGPLNIQQNWDSANTEGSRQPITMLPGSQGDFYFGFESNSLKPYVDTRTGWSTPSLSGNVKILGHIGNKGLPVTPAGTMIDDAYATLFPVISDNRGYMYQDDGANVAGDWSNTAITDAYVGIELTLAGGTSYGWLHFIDNPTASPVNLTLADWAYESTPGTGILTQAVVPEPTTVALIGLGLSGLLISRGRKARSAN